MTEASQALENTSSIPFASILGSSALTPSVLGSSPTFDYVVVSFESLDNSFHSGFLEEISAYEMALSAPSIPKSLSEGQTFKNIQFQGRISERFHAKLFLRKIVLRCESHIFVFQVSGACEAWNQVTAILSSLHHREAFSPIFYSKSQLEKQSHKGDFQQRTPPVEDFMTGGEESEAQYVRVDNPFMNPQWFYPSLSSYFFKAYIVVADEVIGVEKVHRCLLDLGIDRSYFSKKANGVSVDFFDSLMDHLGQHCDIEELHQRAGTRVVKTHFLREYQNFFSFVYNPNVVFKRIHHFFDRLSPSRTYSYEKLSYVSGLVCMGWREGHKPSHQKNQDCEFWKSVFETHLHLITGFPGRVKKVTCCHDGHSYCSYKLEWEPTKYKRLMTFMLLLTFGLCAWLYIQGGLQWVVYILLGLWILRLLFSLRDERDRIKEELNIQNEGLIQKYGELQDAKNTAYEAYHEAQILSELTKRIHSFEKIENILNPTLKGICVRFEYDRAFVMLPDSLHSYLEVKSAYGLREKSLHIWNYKVSLVGQAELARFMATSFKTGQPLILTDLPHSEESQFSEASQIFIKAFHPENICLMPMKVNGEAVGLLVVERKKEAGDISQRDITLLERLGQTLGLAIEKEKQYERESLLRSSFQRFVPMKLVDSFLDKTIDALKSEKKNITVVFVDIRDFTELTNQMIPEKLVYFLNRFYSVTNIAAKNTGGMIDKFLGDGVLVLWGVYNESLNYGESLSQESRALEFFKQLQGGLKAINEEDVQWNLPEVKVGVGMGSGEAIVGTLGDNIKMEHTAVGPVVNLASRLEGLCKIHGTECVVSSEFLKKLNPFEQSQFEVLREEYIHGVGRYIEVGVIRPSEKQFFSQ